MALAEPMNLLPFDGSARLISDAMSRDRSAAYRGRLMTEVEWQQEYVTVMGRTLPAPRLTAWYGDADYVYSGVRHLARAMPPVVADLKRAAERAATTEFNAVLLNLYRDGADSVSWHADNELSLGRDPIIASLSFGETRKFQLKHRHTGHRVDVALKDGSILVMAGPMQHHWLHQIPKTKRVQRPRINLTFRKIVTDPAA